MGDGSFVTATTQHPPTTHNNPTSNHQKTCANRSISNLRHHPREEIDRDREKADRTIRNFVPSSERMTKLTNAMLILALSKTFVTASRSMPSSMLRSTDALFGQRPSMVAFSILPSKTSNTRHYSLSNIRMVSSTDVELSSDPAAQVEQKSSTPPLLLLHTVMVHRNRQSASFREGTPLIFGGSVAATFTDHCLGDSQASNSNIPMGSLVAVTVSRDPPPKGKGKKDSRGRKRTSKGSDKKEKENTPVPHYSFNNADTETNHRDNINQSQLIGFGVFNPSSMYRVRILCHETMHPGLTKEIRSARKKMQRGSAQSEKYDNDMILQLILERQLSNAIRTRLALNLPSPITDTYRLVNGEGDGLSGLAVDVLGGSTAIVMSSAAWCEIHKEIILSVLEKSLKGHPSYEGKDVDIVWRTTPNRLNQDGYEVLSKGSENDEEDEKGEISVVATESSVKYLTYPYSDGQKTGFYCDQRENRLMVAELCRNKRVLDLCCYNGGFALNAMIQGGATGVVGVDSSQDAVEAAEENAKLNGLAENDVSFVKDDIASYMKSAIEAGDEFDCIVLDPPKLAPSVSSLDKASRKYHALNRDAMNLISKDQGGLLLTCTCSAAMTQKDGGQYFLNMVNGAALSAKRRVTLLRVSGAASCHTQSPASFPAGAYLSAALFHVGPADT
ncbi:hypothetical protein ACHAXR_005520 [Thalassiosira sp. AJA248-18]